jgi:RimJ/RimL family protein N-acetyltransferase
MSTYRIPQTLESERLKMRMFQENDWKDLHDYFGDLECGRYTSGRALQEHETWQKVAALIGHWQLRNYGSYALEEKSSSKVIGIAGLDYPIDWPEPEIQWGLSRKFWGKGYASEAVRSIKQMTSQYIPDISLISLIHPDNSNSANLAKAVGARFEKNIMFRGDTCSIYRH